MSTLMKYKYWIGGAFSLFVLALIIGAIRPKGVSGAPTAPPAEVQENIIVRGKTPTRYGMFREDVLQCDGTFKRVQRCVLSLAARVQQPSELTLDAATHILRTDLYHRHESSRNDRFRSHQRSKVYGYKASKPHSFFVCYTQVRVTDTGAPR